MDMEDTREVMDTEDIGNIMDMVPIFVKIKINHMLFMLRSICNN